MSIIFSILIFALILLGLIPTVLLIVVISLLYRNSKNHLQQNEELSKDIKQTNKEILTELSSLKEKTNSIEKMLREVE